MMTLRIKLGLGLAALLVAGCGQAPSDKPAEAASVAPAAFVLNGDAAKGADQYARSCASCHGVEGRGDGVGGLALPTKPTNFIITAVSAERAYLTTKGGGMAAGLSPLMPPFERAMSDQELRDVVAFVLSLHDGELQ